MKDLSELSGGDLVVLSVGSLPHGLAEVERVTKTQILAAGCRFHKATGYRVGETGWHRTNIWPASEEDITRIRKERARALCIETISSTAWSRLDDKTLRDIYGILKARKEGLPAVAGGECNFPKLSSCQSA